MSFVWVCVIIIIWEKMKTKHELDGIPLVALHRGSVFVWNAWSNAASCEGYHMCCVPSLHREEIERTNYQLYLECKKGRFVHN